MVEPISGKLRTVGLKLKWGKVFKNGPGKIC